MAAGTTILPSKRTNYAIAAFTLSRGLASSLRPTSVTCADHPSRRRAVRDYHGLSRTTVLSPCKIAFANDTDFQNRYWTGDPLWPRALVLCARPGSKTPATLMTRSTRGEEP